jgi:hypothetical protein
MDNYFFPTGQDSSQSRQNLMAPTGSPRPSSLRLSSLWARAMARADLALGNQATSPGLTPSAKSRKPTLMRFYFCINIVGRGFFKQFNRGDAGKRGAQQSGLVYDLTGIYRPWKTSDFTVTGYT